MFKKIAKHRANDASNDVHRPPLVKGAFDREPIGVEQHHSRHSVVGLDKGKHVQQQQQQQQKPKPQ